MSPASIPSYNSKVLGSLTGTIKAKEPYEKSSIINEAIIAI